MRARRRSRRLALILLHCLLPTDLGGPDPRLILLSLLFHKFLLRRKHLCNLLSLPLLLLSDPQRLLAPFLLLSFSFLLLSPQLLRPLLPLLKQLHPSHLLLEL